MSSDLESREIRAQELSRYSVGFLARFAADHEAQVAEDIEEIDRLNTECGYLRSQLSSYRDRCTNRTRERNDANAEAQRLRNRIGELIRERDAYREKFEALQRLHDSRDREVRNAAYERAADYATDHGDGAMGEGIRGLKEEQ